LARSSIAKVLTNAVKRSCSIVFALPFFAALLLAQSSMEPDRPAIRELESNIQSELQIHGERVMGHEMVHWSTRLEKISNCRAQFTVRVSSNYGEPSVRTNNVSFSLGAIEPVEIALVQNWLQLRCAGQKLCINSFSTCAKTTREGIVVDCGASSQKSEEIFPLQLDGDPKAAARLEQYFSLAVDACHQATPVSF